MLRWTICGLKVRARRRLFWWFWRMAYRTDDRLFMRNIEGIVREYYQPIIERQVREETMRG